MKKLYVGNLSYSVTQQDLETLFSQYGELVQATVIRDRETGRSKGFGFVEYNDIAAAEAALALDGQDYEGRPLKVSIARGKAEGGGGGSRDRGSYRGGDRNRGR